MKGYIYKFQNKINNKVYIGQTRRNYKIRYNEHIRSASKQLDTCPIHLAIQKYGIQHFEFSILDTIDEITKEELVNKLNNLEIKYISEYSSLVPNGYNVEKGGNSYNYNLYDNELYKNYDILYNSTVLIPNNFSLSPKHLFLYCILEAFSKNNIAKVTINTLISYVNLSIPTIRKMLQELQSANYINIQNEGSHKFYYVIPCEKQSIVDIIRISQLDLTLMTKAYLIAAQQFMYKDIEGVGKISFSNNNLSEQINMPESSIRKCNTELVRKNYLTIVKNKSRDIETGCKTDTKIFNLNELGQAIIWVLQNHEERIEQNTNDINELRKQVEKQNELINKQQELIDKLLEERKAQDKKYIL